MVRHALLSIIVLLAVALLGAPAAAARNPALTLGQISAFQQAPSRHQQTLREALRQELAAARPQGAKSEEPLIVHARLGMLRTERKPLAHTRCTVSLMLLHADSGSLLGTVESKVKVQEPSAARAERLAIQAAAKGAVGRLMSTLGTRRAVAGR